MKMLHKILHKKNTFLFFLIISLFSNIACSADIRFSGQKRIQHIEKQDTFYVGQVITGNCSYYGKKFHGRKTASGEVYDMYQFTAAHQTLPFGTILEVENIVNNKRVRVKINDRGPFKKGRILDISYAAAKEIDLIQSGVVKIKAVIIKLGENNKKKK